MGHQSTLKDLKPQHDFFIGIETISRFTDILVVSQTPLEAQVKEFRKSLPDIPPWRRPPHKIPF
jgi:hypothetical protein